MALNLTNTRTTRSPLTLKAYRLFSRLVNQHETAPRQIKDYVQFGLQRLEATLASRSILVYAATIGEFQAIRPLIDALAVKLPESPLVLLAGQEQYVGAMHEAYPEAIVGGPPNLPPAMLDELFALARPRLVIFGEGPCLHARFPIRLDLSLPAACLYHKTPLFVANACMYELHLASRRDRLEHKLFSSLHRDAVTSWFTPASLFSDMLCEAGADKERVMVTGDMKFDTVMASPRRDPPPDLTAILSHLEANQAPVLVAGSTNAIDEQKAVIRGWARTRQQHPGAALVIAPRYINNARVMGELYDFLESEGIQYARRSEGPDRASQADLLVVDVFGELPFYYERASVCYIGRNHGVLEPLRYSKPIVVAPREDWRKDYAAYPLYHLMVERGGIIEAESKATLGDIFLRLLEDSSYRGRVVETAKTIIDEQQGATQRVLKALTDGGYV